jgi:PHD/YefM family antitoxin component YafN of YafNO toxin-antitoxin module
MDSTNPKKLRAELKDYLDLAAKEPVRIQRRSGETFILISEDQYAEMQNEILALQRRLLGMSQVADGQGKEYKPGSGSRAKRFGKKASSE